MTMPDFCAGNASRVARGSAARIGWLGLVLAASAFAAQPSFAINGGCEEQRFQSGYLIEDGKRIFEEDKFRVFGVRSNTPIYKNATGPERLRDTIGFDQRMAVTDPGLGTQRIRVRKLSDEDIGWVERDDLLCRVVPITDPGTGLLRRVVIQTETAIQGQVLPRLAYHAPNGQCDGGNAGCPKLSRFHWYFVYAEEGGYALLSEAAGLGREDTRLVGWLSKSDGIEWNTAIALRPSETLDKKKAPDGTSEAHICAFPTVDAINDAKACRPVLGGYRWFKVETRLPILRDHGKVYEVAISSAATSGNFEEALSLAGVDALKNLDLFFVIDGTKSMQGAIDAIKGRPGFPGIVDQIRARIKGKVKEGGAVRYGYRIYRDSQKGGPSGVEDDGLPLGNECTANDEQFGRTFQSVKAQDSANDNDFAENLYGGLIQASRDLSSCPDHLKLIVVIGDHGYDAEAQRQRGHKVYDIDAVVQRYIRGRRLNTQPIVLFIQGPSEIDTVNNKDAYRKSYEAFRGQGEAILKGVYAAFQAGGVATPIKHDDFFFQMQSRQADSAMIDRIIARVDQLLQPDVVGKLMTRLKSGESLKGAIEAMQRGDRANVPILYWNVIADALCKRLGDQCHKQVLEGVFKAYIPHNPDLVHDVLLSQSQLEHWREVLGKFKTFWSLLRSGERSRAHVVNTLAESIGSVLKLNVDDSGRTIGEFVQLAGGLPHGSASKLMAYTPSELRNEKLVEVCEIQHLVNYAGKKADVIQTALEGDKLAEFKEETLPISACPMLTPKGKLVPHLPGAPTPRPLNRADANTDYSIRFRKNNDRYYWIPIGYLP
jgi:hypothetical protein